MKRSMSVRPHDSSFTLGRLTDFRGRKDQNSRPCARLIPVDRSVSSSALETPMRVEQARERITTRNRFISESMVRIIKESANGIFPCEGRTRGGLLQACFRILELRHRALCHSSLRCCLASRRALVQSFSSIQSGSSAVRWRNPATCRGDDKVPVPAGTMRGLERAERRSPISAFRGVRSALSDRESGCFSSTKNQNHELLKHQASNAPRKQGKGITSEPSSYQ